jgi:hypothetical protein
MVRLNGKHIRHHFEGVHGKVVQMRELVDVLDQMFDSFHKVNKISKSMIGSIRPSRKDIDRT